MMVSSRAARVFLRYWRFLKTFSAGSFSFPAIRSDHCFTYFAFSSDWLGWAQRSTGRKTRVAMMAVRSGCMQVARACFVPKLVVGSVLTIFIKDRVAGLTPSECENGCPECAQFLCSQFFHEFLCRFCFQAVRLRHRNR